MVEPIISPGDPDRLYLEIWDGQTSTLMDTVVHRGIVRVPPPIVPGLMRAVRFPPASKPFPSAQELVGQLRQFLAAHAFLLPEAQDLLVAFVLSSWFVDCTPLAPILYLVGPDSPVRLVLRVLGGLCRYPILLGDIDLAALKTLPPGLGATMLIGQRDLQPSVRQVLRASAQREFQVHRGGRTIDVYGAKAFWRDARPEPGEEPGLNVFLTPAPHSLPILTDDAARAAMEDLQSQLLRYRMVYRAPVRTAAAEGLHRFGAMRDLALTWLAPICDCADLKYSVLQALSQQSREIAGERFCDLKCIALEAALAFCHKPGVEHFFVGEAAKIMNDLLLGRHEDIEVTAKKAGSILGSVGVFGERVTQGCRITLTDAVREQIHRLARAYQVLSVQDGVSRCNHCAKAESS